MRTLPTALVAVAAVASLAFTVAPTAGPDETPDLEAVPYISEDLAGDANGINGQGLADIVGVDVPETATAPAQYAESDILGARITSQYDEVTGEDGLTDYVMTGLEFRIAMAAEPDAASVPQVHRFIGSAGGCTFWVTVDTGTGLSTHGDPSIGLFGPGCGIPNDPDTGLQGSEYVSGDWLTYAWDDEFGEMVLAVDLAGADERLSSNIERGDYYFFDEIHNRVATLITAPVLDELLEDGYAVIGADIPADEQPATEEDPATEEGGSMTDGDSETGGTSG